MQAEQVPTKARRVADLLYKVMQGTATMQDQLKVQALVTTCDGPTYDEAAALARMWREHAMPVLFAPVKQFAA